MTARENPAERNIVLVLSMLFHEHGGLPRFNQMLCLALDELAPVLGFKGTVLSLWDTDQDYAESGTAWKNLRFVPCGSKWRIALKTLALCMTERVDAILIGLLGMSPVGLLAGPFTKRGFAYIVHGIDAWGHVPLSRRPAARRARFVYAVSRYTADELCRHTKVDPSRIRILPNTLAPGFESVAKGTEADTPDGLEMLTVSRLWAEEKHKGVDRTIEVFPKVLAKFPQLRYRIVGAGSDRPRLMALAATLGVKERVIFEQGLSDSELSDRYRRASLFVLPSGQEGFGIVFLEAMRFAKPCIGGRPGGSPEVIDDGRTGLIVPYGDAVSLESALERLLGDAELRTRMGEAGKRRLEEHFVFARFREKVETYLREWLVIPGVSPAGIDRQERRK